MTNDNIIEQFKTSSTLVKIIVINAVVFILARLLAFFVGMPVQQFMSWFILPDAFTEFITQPWAFFTYSFLHFGLFHVLFNMIWLYMFGRIFLNLFTEKRLLTIYLLGAFFGGVLYVASYNVFPIFEGSRSYLIGASASVMALMVFMATYSPNTTVRVFMFNVKLWQIAAFFVLLDLVRLPGSGNAGGLLAHLGGALYGYVYARQLMKGNDIGRGFESVLDWLTDLFKPRKKKPFRKVHRTAAKKATTANSEKPDRQKKIDAILDKIGKSGYDSLTKAEKDFLFKAGKEDQ
jgi:membrane associated rhomboid family serine protease